MLGGAASWMGACVVAGVAALCGGCAPDIGPIPAEPRPVDLRAFSSTSAARPEVVEVPGADFEPPEVATEVEAVRMADGETSARSTTVERAVNPATSTPQTKAVARGSAQTLRVGQRWPIESLVGQINGRPIYAEEFFRPIEDRILVLAARPDQAAAKLELRQIVNQRFNNLINSELVIAEAQSRLSPDMQKGVFAWLRDMQERTIAQSGGSRSQAEEQLREQTGLGVEEYIQQRKNYELSLDLLRRKVDPRVIVSWRDVERLYDFNRAQYAPEPVLKLGRIRLLKSAQTDKIEECKRLLAEGRPFSEVATTLGMPDGGFWRDVRVGPDGMQISDLTDDLVAALRPLKIGEVAGPIEQRTHVVWVSVLSEVAPKIVSIFDPAVQLSLRAQLFDSRRAEAQQKYIMGLRSRWLSTEIQKMEFRLLTIALTRYFDPSRS
jgi:hypothetical protein